MYESPRRTPERRVWAGDLRIGGETARAKAEAARETLNLIAADTAAAPQLQTNGTMRLEGDAGALLVTLARKAVQLHVSVRQQG